MRLARLSDFLSPILVKELRQGRRSRALIVLAALTIVASGLITLYAIGRDAHADAFIALYACLSVVGFLIVPLTAHRSLVREQEDGSWQILHLTGLGPRRILAGKLAASLAQVAILSLAVSPFLILSHFLTEHGLESIALLCASGALMTAGLIVAALFTATLPTTRAQRGVLQIVVLIGLIFGMSGCVAFAVEVGRRGVERFNLVASLWGVISTSLVLFEAAAARMSLSTENYAWRARVALILQLIGVMALGVWRQRQVTWASTTEFFQVLSVVIISAGALVMATEADRAGPPERKTWSLLAPGALSGFRLSVLLLVLATAFWSVVSEHAPVMDPPSPEGTAHHLLVRLMLVAAAYPLLYLCAVLGLCRGVNPRLLGSPDATRFVLGGVALVGSFVPWLMAQSFARGAPEETWVALLSPVGGYAAFANSHGNGPWVLGGLALLAVVLTDRLLARRASAA